MGPLGLVIGSQLWENATKNFSTLWWKERLFWVGLCNERQKQFGKNKIWLLTAKVFFFLLQRPGHRLKCCHCQSLSGPWERLRVLFIPELTCCQCLKELSERLAKVTQSLPMEVVSPKGWGLFVTSCYLMLHSTHTPVHRPQETWISGLLCPSPRPEMQVSHRGRVPCARLHCNGTENIL